MKLLIRIYQKVWVIRHLVGQFLGFPQKTCRFRPTCSQYFYQAIKNYGIIYGSLLGIKRVVKCNPWNAGGWDPLPRI